MLKSYAGIGSRNAPTLIQLQMMYIGKVAGRSNVTLQSGGANGADLAFERGCDSAKGPKNIYLPWKGFNGNPSSKFSVSEEALVMAARLHPNWKACSRGAKLLMARNCYQILTESLSDPVDFVVCYTSDGRDKGGTGQAMRLASLFDVPIHNLYYKDAYLNVLRILQRSI